VNVSFEEPVLMKMREMAKEKGWPFSRVVNDIANVDRKCPNPAPISRNLPKKSFANFLLQGHVPNSHPSHICLKSDQPRTE